MKFRTSTSSQPRTISRGNVTNYSFLLSSMDFWVLYKIDIVLSSDKRIFFYYSFIIRLRFYWWYVRSCFDQIFSFFFSLLNFKSNSFRLLNNLVLYIRNKFISLSILFYFLFRILQKWFLVFIKSKSKYLLIQHLFF